MPTDRPRGRRWSDLAHPPALAKDGCGTGCTDNPNDYDDFEFANIIVQFSN
jgi:hypothetical protein